MIGGRDYIASKQYRLAWTDAAAKMRNLTLPGTCFSYSFVERDAQAGFDKFWLTLGTSVSECIRHAVSLAQDAAKHVSDRNAAEQKAAADG
jgi:hypothetical protein